MSVLKNYGFSILLLGGVLLGGISGVIWGTDTIVVKPIGDLFLNMMFVLIVPLVFFSISSAICNLKKDGGLVGKLIMNIILVFLTTAIISALMAYVVLSIFNPFDQITVSSLQAENYIFKEDYASLSIGELLVKTFTVEDFSQLFTKSNLLPLIVFSILFGVAAALLGEKSNFISNILSGFSDVILKMMNILMFIAPVGLGCYFAYTIGQLGAQLLNGYLYAFIVYLVLTVISFFGLNTLYAYISDRKQGVKLFWQNILTPSLTAISTSSSAASMPVNIEYAKRIGVPDKIAETVIPLGTNMHKDGSVMGGILKIIFMITLFSSEIAVTPNFLAIIGMAILVGAVMGAIPSGGMTGELLICTVFGLPVEMVGALMIISTIIDAPATLINSTGNVACSMLVARFTEGRQWLQHKD